MTPAHPPGPVDQRHHRGGRHAERLLRRRVEFVATGQIFAMIDTLGVHTNPIVALDLSMVVPVALFAAV